jgi:hypothetical protein
MARLGIGLCGHTSAALPHEEIPMPDDFARHETGLTAPARAAVAITPSDSVALANTTRAIYVGVAGNLRVRLASDDIVTFSGVLAGVVYPFRVEQVMATGTTAGGLVGLR